jgi:ABC-type lipoprotein release transport system permease subunit
LVLLLALLVALVVGGVMGVAIGDRRNATAYDRLIRSGGGPDLLVTPGQNDDGGPAVSIERVRAVPGVRSASSIGLVMAAPIAADGSPDFSDWTFSAYGPTDERFFTEIMRPIVVAGRLPDPDRPTEAVVNEAFARRFHVGPGSTLALIVADQPNADRGTRTAFHVTGVVRFPDEIVQSENSHQALFVTSSGFTRAHPSSSYAQMIAVDLAHPEQDTNDVRRAITATSAANPPGFASMVNHRSVVRLATCAVNSTMIVFTIVFGLIGLIVLGRSLSRLQRSRLRDSEVLAAIGANPMTRFWVALALPAAGILLGLVGAGVLATALSPLFPVGMARRAELHPGLTVNLAWTAAGLGISSVVLSALAAAITWQVVAAPRREPVPVRPSRTAEWMRRAGFPLAAVYGTRRALTPSPGHASTRRGTVGVALGVAGIVLAVVFTTNVRALVQDPPRFGWSWDELVELNAGPGSSKVSEIVHRLQRSSAVSEVSVFTPRPLTVDGVRYPGVAVAGGEPPVHVELVSGRMPEGTDEVALGGRTMHQLGLHLGDAVRLGRPAGTKTIPVHVVGQVVLPAVGVELMADTTSLGYGVFGPDATISRLGASAQSGVAIRYAAGASNAARRDALQPFAADLAASNAFKVSGVQMPDDIVGLDGIGMIPSVLMVALAALVVVELGLTLFSSVRTRRRDLAVLKGMGFVRSQLVGIVLWEATVSAALAALAGAVVGVALGRFAWLILTGDLALASTTVTPIAAVVATACATVIVADVVALLPAQVAARTSVSTILQSE